MRFFAPLMAVCVAGIASADTFPAYQWTEEDYICSELGRKLTEEEFLNRALIELWSSGDGSLRAEFGAPAEWRSVHPECCEVQINDHSWSLRKSQTEGISGWVTLLLSSPTILVTVSGPERDPGNSRTGMRTRTYLLNVCGGVKDQFGGMSAPGIVPNEDWQVASVLPWQEQQVDQGSTSFA